MNIRFNQSVMIGKLVFQKGIREVSDDVLKHPYFLKLMKVGIVEDGPEKKVALTAAARQQRLIERIASLGKEKVPPGESDDKDPQPSAESSEAPEASDPHAEGGSDEEVDEEGSEDGSEESEESDESDESASPAKGKKKKKKKNR